MSSAHLILFVLWLVPVTLQAAIAFVMLRRGLTKLFPIFFSYTVFIVTREFILQLLPYPGKMYSTIFWWGDAVAILLSLGVILEVLRHLFLPYQFLHFVFKVIWIAAFVVAAFALSLLRLGPGGTDRLLESILLMERSARVLQLSLLIVLIFFMSRLGLAWHHCSVGIAAGFGAYSALDLVLLELRAHLHLVTDTVFVLLTPAAYNLGVLIWAFYLLRPPALQVVDRLPVTDLTSWHDTLSEYVKQWYQR